MPQAGGLRNRNAAAFCLLKKYAPHFFNPTFGVTRQKEAAYPVTGNSAINLWVADNLKVL
ncbi:hypothetical protein DC498_07495 [Terrimonas sp.]|nr:hypothetical protein DC498_07495 [Terrimonas sp.]